MGPRFNPLSTGHAPGYTATMKCYTLCFNPLSTGHAPRGEQNPHSSPPSFQSPIYGSRTKRPPVKTYSQKIRFNPLSTGHAPFASLSSLRSGTGFQSPIYGSRTDMAIYVSSVTPTFQSPIYGSRTDMAIYVSSVTPTFQSPIYGSRTHILATFFALYGGFNPLSTGHALITFLLL